MFPQLFPDCGRADVFRLFRLHSARLRYTFSLRLSAFASRPSQSFPQAGGDAREFPPASTCDSDRPGVNKPLAWQSASAATKASGRR